MKEKMFGTTCLEEQNIYNGTYIESCMKTKQSLIYMRYK